MLGPPCSERSKGFPRLLLSSRLWASVFHRALSRANADELSNDCLERFLQAQSKDWLGLQALHLFLMSEEDLAGLGEGAKAPLGSKMFSSGSLLAGLTTVDFQQCKIENMEREIKEPSHCSTTALPVTAHTTSQSLRARSWRPLRTRRASRRSELPPRLTRQQR